MKNNNSEKNYRFAIKISIAIGILAFIISFFTLNFFIALTITTCLVLGGAFLTHPRVLQELKKMQTLNQSIANQRQVFEQERDSSQAYDFLPNNSGHTNYLIRNNLL